MKARRPHATGFWILRAVRQNFSSRHGGDLYTPGDLPSIFQSGAPPVPADGGADEFPEIDREPPDLTELDRLRVDREVGVLEGIVRLRVEVERYKFEDERVK